MSELGKRVYLPLKIQEPCPSCGKMAEQDLEMQPLNYPEIDVPEELSLYCEHCDFEWLYGKVTITFKLERLTT